MSFSTAFAQQNCLGDPMMNCGGGGDAYIPVIVTQPQGATLVGEEQHKLFVEVAFEPSTGPAAIAGDTVDVKLTYEWYVCSDETKRDRTLLSYSSENFLFVNGSAIERYYFAAVYYYKDYSKGYLESAAAKVVGTKRLNAAVPIIGREPRNESTALGKMMGMPLSVSAWASDGGTLSYQWFSNPNRNDTAGWTPIEGANKDNFSPDISNVGTIYYRVVVTNTNTDVEGEKTASKMSNAVAIRVEGMNTSNAKFPDVSVIKTVSIDTAKGLAELSAEAKSPDGGTLSYQWYRTSSESNVGGEPIEGATDANLALDLATATPDVYYYVEVTNTNDKANGDATAIATSNAKSLIMGGGATTAVKTNDRLIPQTKASAESAAVAPITASASGFTAGPNPVNRSRGAVVFFHHGKRFKDAALSVYDASGAFVKKAAISGNAANGQSRRQVGSWDLTDSKGHTVPSGTYLVKGVIKTVDGKSEKVSLVVGVR
jgi:hypothetical protein